MPAKRRGDLSGDNCLGHVLRASVLCVQPTSVYFPLSPEPSSLQSSNQQGSLHKNTTPNFVTSGDVTVSVCGVFGCYPWHESGQSSLPSKRHSRKASTHSNILLGLSSPPPAVSKGRLQTHFKDRVENTRSFQK